MPIASSIASRQDTITVLGIESSCDETAASVLRLRGDDIELLSSRISSQDEKHRPFGGVVPEIAARAHMAKIDQIITGAMDDSGLSYDDIDGVAATAGPGLIGGVITGLMAAKGLSVALNKPLLAVNHLEGHALSPALSEPCPFPYLLLLVSGGHTQLLAVGGLDDYTRLGSTVDDAAGEAFDKTAKVMGLGFPGGPNVEKWAKSGDATRFKLPRPFKSEDHADFSFAGLKTAALRAYDSLDNPSDQDMSDLAASFQMAVTDALTDRTARAMEKFEALYPNADKLFVVAGGVAANATIRGALTELCADRGYKMSVPPLKFCTDNAAMIALAGAMRLQNGMSDDLSAQARPRWPLDKQAAKADPASGSGRKGPKS